MHRAILLTLTIGVAAYIGVAVPARAGMDEGVQAYQAGDYERSYREFASLAEAGNVAAQYNIAQMYRYGQGVPQDYAAALAWYEKAAEAGLSSAQNNLGHMLAEGKGTAIDYARAVAWWRRAAMQDHVSAQFNVGTAYHRGIGGDADPVEALFWYSLAMVNGYLGARPIREQLATTMNLEQLVAVSDRVKSWQPMPERPQ